MSDSADIGAVPASAEGERHERGRFGDLGDRLARVFPRQRRAEEESTVAVLEETVEFTPPDVQATPEWTGPQFPRAWPGYHRPVVDQYIADLELELDALRAERVPDARAREEIASVGDETSAILVVAHEIPLRYAINAADGSDDLDGPAHQLANATPYLFDRESLARAVEGIERLT